MIDRNFTLVAILALALLALPLAAGAQQAEKVYRISVLGLAPGKDVASQIKGIRERLRELGYIEGKNLIFEYRSAEGRQERLTELATELARDRKSVV